MEYPLTARRVALSALAVCTLAAATACGGAQGEEGGGQQGSATAKAEQLHSAQLAEFGEAKLVPDRSELGTYAKLSTTKRTEKLRASAELDKPQCMDAANQWADLPAVRKAPTSLATYARGHDTITHTLFEVSGDTADKVVAAAPPAECSDYEATMEDGSTTSYALKKLDLDPIGDGSRAFAVETGIGGEKVWLYSLVYRNGDHLGTTSVLGPNGKDDYRETLAAFTDKAIEREDKVLG
ncbi:hypothetical protein GCM10027570_44390 [Streptomonospora sediminis]